MVWPALGLLSIALFGSAAHVSAGRTPLGNMERVALDFYRLPFLRGNETELCHALSILLITGLPLLLSQSGLLIVPQIRRVAGN